MRIRTLKPEFWLNEDLAQLDDFTRLLAIGLLNYADDDGYFNANPGLIRSALFPLRDESGSVPVAITHLSNAGYVKLYHGSDGRTYGHVVNFEKHQVINKWKSSKIKPLCVEEAGLLHLSGSPTVVLPSGTGNREQGTGKGNREYEQGASAPETVADTAQPPKAEKQAPDPRLKRPTIAEWLAYGAEIEPKWPESDARGAFDHYEANGWKQASGNPIKNWAAACRTCIQRFQQRPNAANPASNGANRHQQRVVTAEEHGKGFFHGLEGDWQQPDHLKK